MSDQLKDAERAARAARVEWQEAIKRSDDLKAVAQATREASRASLDRWAAHDAHEVASRAYEAACASRAARDRWAAATAQAAAISRADKELA